MVHWLFKSVMFMSNRETCLTLYDYHVQKFTRIAQKWPVFFKIRIRDELDESFAQVEF